MGGAIDRAIKNVVRFKLNDAEWVSCANDVYEMLMGKPADEHVLEGMAVAGTIVANSDVFEALELISTMGGIDDLH